MTSDRTNGTLACQHTSRTEEDRTALVVRSKCNTCGAVFYGEPWPDELGRSGGLEGRAPLDKVFAATKGVPHIAPAQGRTIYDFVLKFRPQRVLELGFAHGVSSCYLAAALEEGGGAGHLLTIDQGSAMTRSPTIAELLSRCGLEHRVTAIFAQTSYNWELMRLLREPPSQPFDFVFIDGAHTWEVDGFAFLLVDRLLRPGGWVLFDDLDWTFSTSPTMRNSGWVKKMPAEERTTPQIRQVFELLVKSNPHYGEFREKGGWAWARKRPDTAEPANLGASKQKPALSYLRALEGRVRSLGSRRLK